MSRKKVLLLEQIHEDGYKLFGNDFDVKVATDTSVETIKREIIGAHGVLVRMAPLTGEMINVADSLQVISKHGAGLDNIDIETATSRGIVVTNTGNVNALSVAEHALAMLLAIAKRMVVLDRATRESHWQKRTEYAAVDLEGKTLGLIGLGQIGSRMARKASALDMHIIGYDPYVDSDNDLLSNLELDLYDQLDEVVRDADFLSLHVPLTVETRGLLDARRLSLMKPGSYLINVSRGGLIDEKVLCEVLSTGHLAGAALDVFETEPLPQDSPLISLENVILSPHSAMATRECIRRLVTEAVLGIVDFLSGKQPKYVTNPEVLK